MFTLTHDDCFRNKDRFEAKIDRSGGPEACHPYTSASQFLDGYGILRLTIAGVKMNVGMHRISYVLSAGEDLNSDDYIDHVVCSNPRCCNPRHLRKTDALGNAQTRKPSERRADRSGCRLFTDDEVMDYRRGWAAGESLASLLVDSGVRGSTIRKIVHGKTYKHLPILLRSPEAASRNPNSLLNESQIAVIKARLLRGDSQSVIGRDYGVSRGVINAIARGRTWAHVEPAVLVPMTMAAD